MAEQRVVPVVGVGTALDGRGQGQAPHQSLRQADGLGADLLPRRPVEDPGHQGCGRPVQGPFRLLGHGPAQRSQPALDLLEGAPDLEPGEGCGRGHHRGADRGQPAALRRAAPLVWTDVGPEPARGEAQRLQHRHVQGAAGQPDPLGERPQPGHHPLAALLSARLLAEVDDDAVGLAATPFAAPDQAVCDLPGGVLPFRGRAGNADAEPAAEAPALAVHGDHDEGVGRVEAEHVGQRVGQFGRAAQGDLGSGGGSGRADGGPVGRGA